MAALMRAGTYAAGLRHAASVDNFLDQVRSDVDFVSVCKMAIGYEIAKAEQGSAISGNLRDSKLIDVAASRGYFLLDLLNFVVRGHQEDNVGESLSRLTFVIFNYDRCLERVLLSWLHMRFPSSAEDLYKLVKIIHVYGSLGAYGGSHGTEFFDRDPSYGVMQNPHLTMPDFAYKIKVFTEQEDSNVASEIGQAMHFARAVMFLGFGFEEQNMRFFRSLDPYEKRIFCTTMGKGKQNELAIEENLREMMKVEGAIAMVDGKAKELFLTYYHPIGRAVGSLPVN
jgi:hypothetical protein